MSQFCCSLQTVLCLMFFSHFCTGKGNKMQWLVSFFLQFVCLTSVFFFLSVNFYVVFLLLFNLKENWNQNSSKVLLFIFNYYTIWKNACCYFPYKKCFHTKKLRSLLLIWFLCGSLESLCQQLVLKLMMYDMGKKVNIAREPCMHVRHYYHYKAW